jgi:putative endonuclease
MYCGGHVYIMSNKTDTVLYTGVTSNLKFRVQQHKEGFHPKSFTKRYNIHKLVYYEGFFDIVEAICREKQIKAGSRKKKVELINKMNPDWKDLYYEYCEST